MEGETSLCLLYSFFWVNPRCLNFMCRCSFSLRMEQMVWSETSTHKIQTLGIHPKERIQHSVHGKSLKSVCVSCISDYFNRMVKYF
jgi:hypothetical protein